MRNLFLLCAGLSLFACSSDDDATNQLPEGTGKVVVKIVPPTTSRATAPFSSDAELIVEGTYDVTLLAAKGGATLEDVEVGNEITFSNVVSPTKVIVSLNGGLNEYTSAITTELGNLPADEVPAYGETTSFSTQAVDENTIYTATVKMAIPFARLEIGKITFEQQNSVFDVLEVGGVYLDKLRDRGGIYDAAGKFTCQAEGVIDYQFSSDPTTKATGELDHVLGDAATGSFLGNSVVVLPGTKTDEADDVYAYNFYGATPSSNDNGKNPYFKIYFNETSLTNENGNKPRYAMITKYRVKNSDSNSTEIVLENGKIYKVTGVDNVIKLSDKNIVDDEEGTVVEYELEVTVEEATWTIESIDADWAQ